MLYQPAQGDPDEDTRSDTPTETPLEGAPPAGAPSAGAGEPTPPAASTAADAAADAQQLLAGKYATKDALLRAVTEAASKYADRAESLEAFYSGIAGELGRQGADVAQMRREIDQGQQPQPTGTADEELAQMMYDDPAGFVRTFRELMGQFLRSDVERTAQTAVAQQTVQQRRFEASEEQFFSEHPDLAAEAEREVVQLVAERMQDDAHFDMSALSPAERAAVLAETSRKLVASLRQSASSAQPPPVSPASRVRTGPTAPQAQRSIQERAMDEWSSDIAAREAMLERRLRLPQPKPTTA